jgi:hypothetical protein
MSSKQFDQATSRTETDQVDGLAKKLDTLGISDTNLSKSQETGSETSSTDRTTSSKQFDQATSRTEADQVDGLVIKLATSGLSDTDSSKSQKDASETSSTDFSNSQETIISGNQNDLEATIFHESQEVLKQEDRDHYQRMMTKLSSPPFLEPATYEVTPSFRVNIDLFSKTIKRPAGVHICAYVTTAELTFRTKDIIAMAIVLPYWSELSKQALLEISDFLHYLFKESFEKLQNLCMINLCLQNSMGEIFKKLNLNWVFLVNPRFNQLSLPWFQAGFKKLNLALTSSSCTDEGFYLPSMINELHVYICDFGPCPPPLISLKNCDSLETM